MTARKLIAARSDADLIRDWEVIDVLPISPEVVRVRGWLMDEIEKRWPVEFDRWIDNCETDDNLGHYIAVA